MRNLAKGLRYVRRTPVVLLAVVVVGVVATVGMNFTVLIPAFAQDELGSGAAGYGFLMAASGVGSLLAAMRLVFGGRPRADPPRDRRADPRRGVARRWRSPREFPVALVLMVLIGFGSILMAATGNTTIQLAVPDHLRGRVMSVYTTVFSASVPIGGLAMGAVASAFGVAGRDRDRRGPDAARRARRARLGSRRRVRLPVGGPGSGGPDRRDGPRRGAHPADGASARLAVDRPEHERRVEPAEPERGRQHAPVGRRRGRPAAGPAGAPRRRDPGRRG